MAEKLQIDLPAGRTALLKAVAEIAAKQDNALYIVGGYVRDLLLGRPGSDMDLVVEGDAIALAQALVKKYGGKLVTHQRFGTAKWQIADLRPELAKKLGGGKIKAQDLPETLDLISARSETYDYPTALPTVKLGSIKDDQRRRDFTINTLALRLDGEHFGELIDPLGAAADLEAGMVRVMHPLSFEDDPTRVLRAVRFEQRFGYQIEPQTLKWLEAALPLIEKVSGDRLRHELDAVMQEENAWAVLSRLQALGVLLAIHEQLAWDAETEARVSLALDAKPEPAWGLEGDIDGYPFDLALKYILWFIKTPSTEAALLMGRLMLPGWLTKMVLRACETCDEEDVLQTGKPSEIADQLKYIPPLTLYAHYLMAKDEKVKESFYRYINEWRHVKPHTNGHDLRQKGIPPGPLYREVLDGLRDAWLDGEVSSQDEEQTLLEKLLEDSVDKTK